MYEVMADFRMSGAAIEHQLVQVTADLKRYLKIPIAVKLSPYFASVANLARRLDQAGADALVLFNRFYQPDIDITTMTAGRTCSSPPAPSCCCGSGGWPSSTGACGRRSSRPAASRRPRTRIKAILAGADAVQVVSAVLRHGPDYFGTLRDGPAGVDGPPPDRAHRRGAREGEPEGRAGSGRVRTRALHPDAAQLETLRGTCRAPRSPISSVWSTAMGLPLIETHISYVLLDGRFAYKIKKAVDLDFLDFTTLSARRFYCGEELRLNRRLAPSLYLDVVPVTGTVEAPVLGGDGTAIEYAVKMRQFDQEGLLSRVLARGELTPARVDEIAAAVASFHGGAARAGPDAPFGQTGRHHAPGPPELRADARGCLRRRRPRASDTAACMDRRRSAARLTPVFERRNREGFVRECHGDLHLGNIALVDGKATLFDCIEFNTSMRWIDVMSDVAFLVMDLRDHGQPGRPPACSTSTSKRPAITGGSRSCASTWSTVRWSGRRSPACGSRRVPTTMRARAWSRNTGRISPSPPPRRARRIAGSSSRTVSRDPARRPAPRPSWHRPAPSASDPMSSASASRGSTPRPGQDRRSRTVCTGPSRPARPTPASPRWPGMSSRQALRSWSMPRFSGAGNAIFCGRWPRTFTCRLPLPAARRRNPSCGRASHAGTRRGHDASEATVEVLEHQLATAEPLAADER